MIRTPTFNLVIIQNIALSGTSSNPCEQFLDVRLRETDLVLYDMELLY
jgi:hypothetical protein